MKNTPNIVQVRLTSATELIRASLEPYVGWIEQMIGVPWGETLTLELDCNPGDAIAEDLLPGLPIVSTTKTRNSSWRALIEDWALAPGLSPRIAVSHQRERKINSAPFSVWELDWQDTPVALKLRGLAHRVISVKVPLVFPPGDSPMQPPVTCEHWFITHREDAAKLLLLQEQVEDSTLRYLETKYGQTRLQGAYDWNSVVLDATTRTLVRNDFELFFEREEWFRQHNLPYRRGYLLWGPPGNGKTACIRVMAAHPFVRAFSLDLSDAEEKSRSVAHMFENAAMHAPALIILEDIDRAFPTEGKRTQERMISFQTLLNCLDGVGSQDGVVIVATANDPLCLDAAILKRPGRFDRVVQFRNPDADLRREYYRRLSPILTGEKFETAILQTEGFSFAQLRETYILGAQLAFSDGREIRVEDVLEAIELHAAGTQNLKTSVAATGFVGNGERTTIR
jgi:hypothetical protein